MLQALLGRWFAKPPPPAARWVTAREMLPAANTAPAATAVAIGARRALVNAGGEIAGYEFRIGAAMLQRLQARPDPSATRAHLNALLAGMRRCAKAGQLAFTALPADWLVMCTLQPDELRGVQVHLLPPHRAHDAPSAQPMADVTSGLNPWRRAGARLGWLHNDAAFAGLTPDFLVHTDAVAPPCATWVAPDLADIDAMDAALRAGAQWAGCEVKLGAEPRQANALPPQARQLMLALNRLLQDDETSVIVEAIERDANLSLRLLQYLNSPGVSTGQALGSIGQAVAVLGRNALYQWLAVLLLRMAPARPAAAALQSLALARANLLQALGKVAGESAPAGLYLLGLVSVLPLLLQVSLSEALASLHLPPEATQALRERQGPWAGYLSLVEALEAADLDTAKVLSAPLGGLSRVMSLSARAWLPD